jgi:hypothetical protein
VILGFIHGVYLNTRLIGMMLLKVAVIVRWMGKGVSDSGEDPKRHHCLSIYDSSLTASHHANRFRPSTSPHTTHPVTYKYLHATAAQPSTTRAMTEPLRILATILTADAVLLSPHDVLHAPPSHSYPHLFTNTMAL